MFALVATYGDGCTYQSDLTLAVFEDEDVAKLVVEELEALVRKKGPQANRDFPDMNHGGFSVQPITVFKAESESRVRGIVDQILQDHFPRS
jgi:hypothetical protein